MLIICFAILSLTTLTHSSVLVGREHPDYEEQFRYDVWICVDYPISKTISNYNDYSGTDAEFRSPINTFSDLSLYPRYPIAERHNSQEGGDLLHVSHLMNSLRYQVIKQSWEVKDVVPFPVTSVNHVYFLFLEIKGLQSLISSIQISEISAFQEFFAEREG